MGILKLLAGLGKLWATVFDSIYSERNRSPSTSYL